MLHTIDVISREMWAEKNSPFNQSTLVRSQNIPRLFACGNNQKVLNIFQRPYF